MFLWLFPVGASWLVATSGNFFSFVGQHWQNKNVELVFSALIISVVSATLTALMVIKFCPNSKVEGKRNAFLAITNAQLVFFGLLAVLSGLGLFLSFGGTIFERAYGGAEKSWLGNGAWSISYLVSIYIISVNLVEKSSIFYANIFTSLAFAPILLSGSRIDYVSVQLAIICYYLFINKKNIKNRCLWALGVAVWTVIVAHVIGTFRNMHAQAIDYSNLLDFPVKNINSTFVNLSTFGDIGASVFQLIGLLEEVPSRMVGLEDALTVYAARLLPGPLFPGRPSGFFVQFSESIGNGATHSLAEGYLISGIFGIMMVSLIIGIFLGFSVVAGRSYRINCSLSSLIIFSFPWLLLIRGSWYQFFAFFKAAEVVMVIFISIVILKWMQQHLVGEIKR